MLRISLALGLYLVTAFAAFGVRTLLQRRRFGDGGWRFHRSSSRAVVSQVLVTASAVLLALAPVAAWWAGDPAEPWGLGAVVDGDRPTDALSLSAGLALLAGGAVLVWAAQQQMGASWRIGVDPEETTDLVAVGLFRWVRNPIFTGMALVAFGQALLVPNVVALVGALIGVVGLQLQVRWVEEPYLIETHGEVYLRWASEVGRFVPGLGRLAM